MNIVDMSTVTTSQLKEARGWIMDCVWADMDEDQAAELTGEQIVKGIERHYEGGWAAFLVDSDTAEPATETKLRFEVKLTRNGSSERVNTFTWGATRSEAYVRVTDMLDRDETWEGWSFELAQEPTQSL